MSTLATRTIEYSCRPWARLSLDGHADAMDAIGAALEADPRALGAGGVGYDDTAGEVSSTFQVAGDNLAAAEASAIAVAVFDDALAAAGLEQRTAGLAIVEGDDPDQLP